MKKRVSLFLVGIMASAVLAGCGSGGSRSKSAESYEEYGSYATDDVYATEAATEEYDAEMPMAKGEGNGVGDSAVENTSRKIIRNVNITAETEEFDSFISNINSRVDALGGYMESTEISGRSISSAKAQMRHAFLVARIPAQNLDSFVTTVAEKSNITNKSESADDVTLNYADTAAHIKSLRTEQERLNELLLQADDIETIIAIEARITDVRYELESYESRLRTMDNQVDYSTVYLNVNEVVRYTVVEEPKQNVWQRISKGFGKNVLNAWEIFVDFIVGLIVGLPMFIVIIIIVAVPASVILLIVKIFTRIFNGPDYVEFKKKQREQRIAYYKSRRGTKKKDAPLTADTDSEVSQEDESSEKPETENKN